MFLGIPIWSSNSRWQWDMGLDVFSDYCAVRKPLRDKPVSRRLEQLPVGRDEGIRLHTSSCSPSKKLVVAHSPD
jgi:hypothetical protein